MNKGSAVGVFYGTLPPKVVLQFGSGHKVSFENSTWSEQRPELLVYDADFIGRNVHSGGAVNTDHRKNFLEFALGEAAVVARVCDTRGLTPRLRTPRLRQLIVEIKGYRREDAKEKKATMDTYWMPGVNNLKQHGRWAFAEFTDVFQMQTDFAKKVEAEFDGMITAVITTKTGTHESRSPVTDMI